MLISLAIKNFLIVEHVYIDFCTSLAVITGETGSGKSLIIDAILFCFGGKFEAYIRKNADQCSVIAEFDIKDNVEIKKFLDENYLEYDSTIIVKRQDTIAQRKKFFVNDQQVTQKLISQIAFFLLEIHGQHSTTILLDSKSHIVILDNYAHLANQKNILQEDYRNWQENMRKIKDISSKRQQNLQEISYLEFIIKELQDAVIRPDEEDELVAKRNKLQQLFSQQKTVYQAIRLIEDSNFNKTAIQLSKILSRDEKFSHCLDLLDQTLIYIDEIQTILNNIVLDNDIEQQIVSIEDRLFEIRTLAKKHNIEVHKIPTFLDISIKKLDILNQEIFDEKNLIQKQDELFQIYQNSCALISKTRQEVGQILEQKINKELSDLISSSASFKVSIKQLDIIDGTSSGIDQVRFTVSTNAGMPHMPIDQVASGGELSRIMLAIKSVMFKTTTKSTIIFDEIDTGVGGAIADMIGEKLKYLSQNAQIITITHQPQIASKGAQHFLVSKSEKLGQTFCTIKELDMNQKIKEIARMLSGKNITSKTTDAAKEMIGVE